MSPEAAKAGTLNRGSNETAGTYRRVSSISAVSATPPSRPIHVIHLSGRSDLSGGPIAMLRLIEGLDRGRFRHTVVCPPSAEGIHEDLDALANVKVHPMALRTLSPGTMRRLGSLLRETSPDLIHTHGKAAGLYGRPLGRRVKIPVIHQHHGLHYRHYPPWVRGAYLMLERRLARWTEKVLCVSESECAEAEALRLFSPEQGVVIPNGVDGERFSPNPRFRRDLRKRWKIPESAWVLLAITRANVQKHLEMTLEVHHRVRQRTPSSVLVLAGVAPRELQRMVAKGVRCDASHVICAPPEHHMHQLINVADCYLGTSRWEGFSIGLIEALAMKLPAVISRVTGNLDLAGLESEGIHLVPQGDADAYVRTINKLLSAEISGRRARGTVLERYSQKRINRMVAELYETVLTGRSEYSGASAEPVLKGRDVQASAS